MTWTSGLRLAHMCLVVAVGGLIGACATGGGEEESFSNEAETEEKVVARSTVVKQGTGRYDIFRIPVLVSAPNGDLLLFSEGRTGRSDFGNIDILLFRSTNDGKTWSAGKIIADNGSNTASDMAAVVKDGRVHLLFQKRPGNRTFNDYLQADASDAHGYHTYSDDSGRTWSQPQEITSQVLPAPDEQLPMFGPNNGIVLDSGRLVVPMYYANQSANDWTPSVIYSDDGGETWQRSMDSVPGQGINETAVVEIGDKEVYAIARDNSGDENHQKRFFRSKDGGETWTEVGDVNPVVPETSCQQSMVALGNRLYLATPEEDSRRDGRLKTGTYDIGQPDNVQWEEDLQLTAGGFAYSTMAIQDSTIHVVYEEKTPDQYASLQYVRVRLR
ncbi:sialidase family protein [Salinibacter ruber]|uniref:sialidase family protein n=1 Tax=Salinibacter ruber TaxID=146919 RepID=UPI0013C2F67F|nr:sialidase family protein [Salinibacter ruber]